MCGVVCCGVCVLWCGVVCVMCGVVCVCVVWCNVVWCSGLCCLFSGRLLRFCVSIVSKIWFLCHLGVGFVC